MRRTTRGALVAVLLAAGIVASSGQAAAPTPLENRRPALPWLSSHAGWTVWSESVDGKYHLLARRAGKTKLLPAPAGKITHDPGAGRGPTGRPTAVYQRCKGISCDIWAVDLASGTQRKVGGLGQIRRPTKRDSDDDSIGAESHPRIWGDRVAFQTTVSIKELPRVRVGPSVAGRGAVKTLRVRPGEDGGEIFQIALGPKHVVSLWSDDFCFGRCIGMYINGIASGRQQTLDEGTGTADCTAYLDNLRFDGSAFRWTRELGPLQSGDTSCSPKINRLRYNPSSGRKTSS